MLCIAVFFCFFLS